LVRRLLWASIWDDWRPDRWGQRDGHSHPTVSYPAANVASALPFDSVKVDVGPSGLSSWNSPLVPCTDGKVDEHNMSGRLISPLFDEFVEQRFWATSHDRHRLWTRHVAIAGARSTPFETFVDVMHTASCAGLTRFSIVVEREHEVLPFGIIDVAPPLERPPGPVPRVFIGTQGITFSSPAAGGEVELAAHDYDGLEAQAQVTYSASPDRRVIGVDADPEVSMERIVRVLDALAGRGCATDEKLCRFTRPYLDVDLGSLVDHAGNYARVFGESPPADTVVVNSAVVAGKYRYEGYLEYEFELLTTRAWITGEVVRSSLDMPLVPGEFEQRRTSAMPWYAPKPREQYRSYRDPTSVGHNHLLVDREPVGDRLRVFVSRQ
jgi:biopolymer transport protein ExbD